jgi:hypothetical protein
MNPDPFNFRLENTPFRIVCYKSNVSQSDRKLWHQTRSYVGGSDASVVTAFNDKKSVVSLVQKIKDKKEGKFVDDDNSYTQANEEVFLNTFPYQPSQEFFFWLGHYREPVAREIYELITMNKVHEGYTWLPLEEEWRGKVHVSPDGIVDEGNEIYKNNMAVVEFKVHCGEIPYKISFEHLFQIYHTFLLLQCRFIDYFAISVDCSTKENFDACKINGIRWYRHYVCEELLSWYTNVLIDFLGKVESEYDFKSRDRWNDYLIKEYGCAPIEKYLPCKRDMTKQFQYATLIESFKGKTLNQIREIASIHNEFRSVPQSFAMFMK